MTRAARVARSGPDRPLREPSLCFAGPMPPMPVPGRVTDGPRPRRPRRGTGPPLSAEAATAQGKVLAELFSSAGYSVRYGSTLRNRYLRLLDMSAMIARGSKGSEVLIVQTYSGPSFLLADVATVLGRRRAQRIVLHLHGGDLPSFMARHRGWALRVMRRADAVVSPTSYLADAARDFGARPEVIPNVIDLSLYPFRPRAALRPRLLWMRAFHPLYNPALALRTLRRVREAVPDATLVMAGLDKGLESTVREDVRRLGLQGAVEMPGFLDPLAKARAGLGADVFLNTNRVDNTPVSVIEACALGLPVVSTNVGGIPHLLEDGVTGLLVDDDDDEGMAAAVLDLFGNPVLAGRLSRNGRTLAEACSWPRVRARWEAVFARLTSVDLT